MNRLKELRLLLGWNMKEAAQIEKDYAFLSSFVR